MIEAGAYSERFSSGARGEESRSEGGWGPGEEPGRKIFDFLTSLDAFSGHARGGPLRSPKGGRVPPPPEYATG